jgi:hypothetical protein
VRPTPIWMEQPRAGWCELDDAEVGGGLVVDVEGEPGLLGVEGGCLVDVADGQGDDLELVVHQAPVRSR